MRLAPLLLAIVTLGAACGDPAASKAPPAEPAAKTGAGAPPTEEVKLARPEYRTRATTLETTGKVVFDEEHLVRLTAPVTGRVVEVLVRPGDVVESGRRLLVLDSPDVGLARSDYVKATADAERADHALRLARDLFEVRAVAQKEVRDAESEYRKATAERDRAAARLRTLGMDPERSDDGPTRVAVTAPRSGVVVERNVSPGQVVAYGQSDAPASLLVIADLSTMWVLADVYEPDVPRVRIGQTVTVTLPCCPGERYQGRVAGIGDAIDRESRTLKVRAVVPNRSRALKGEMFARVSIDTGARQALVVPVGAIHRDGSATFVLVEKAPGDYERRPVTTGAEADGTVEIVSGVTPAESVVSSGGILLKRAAR